MHMKVIVHNNLIVSKSFEIVLKINKILKILNLRIAHKLLKMKYIETEFGYFGISFYFFIRNIR